MGRDETAEADDIFFNQRQRRGQGVRISSEDGAWNGNASWKRSINASELLLLPQQIEGWGEAGSTSSGHVCCLFSLETQSQSNTGVFVQTRSCVRNATAGGGLPSLHQEGVSPGFTLPVELEPGTKETNQNRE